MSYERKNQLDLKNLASIMGELLSLLLPRVGAVRHEQSLLGAESGLQKQDQLGMPYTTK